MLFTRSEVDRIKRGDVTIAFRRWKRPAARPGGRHRLDADGVIEVTSVDLVDERGLRDEDARAAGQEDLAALKRALSRFDVGTTRTYAIRFRYVPERDAREALAANEHLSIAEMADVIRRLERMDAASSHGPWTLATLEAIEAQPATLAAKLAESLGRERLAFKADVRKIKALGLTISLERGYRLSPRGSAVLKQMRQAR